MENDRAEIEMILDILESVLHQACTGDDGRTDSMALSAYADGLRILSQYKRFKIDSEYGRRVIGQFIDS